MDPANYIDLERRNLLDLAVLDRNKQCAFGAALPDMPALKVAAKCDMRPLVQNCGLVNMGQRPVVVSLVDQVLHGARRIIDVAPHAAEPGMEDTEIEATSRRGGISGDKVLRDVALPEALAVQCNFTVPHQKCFWPPCRKHADVRRKDKAARNLTFGVMIAIEQEHRDLSLRETAHLPDEEQSGLVVAPVAVIEIARDDNKGDLLFDRLAYEIIERSAGRGANAF